MSYNVGISIRRGLREVQRTIIRVNAASRNKAILAAEDKLDRQIGPDLWSKAIAVTEACRSEASAAA